MSTELTVATPGKYDLESVAETAAGWREELGDDFVPDFPRIKVPGAGGTVWEDDEGNPHKQLNGVIVGFHKSTRLYLEKLDGSGDGGSRPDAWSTDGKVQIVPPETVEKALALGLPVPLVNLALCPYYQWESAPLNGGQGKGKATREYREVYLLLEGQGVIPFHLSIPATSIKAFDAYAQNTVIRKGSLSAVETVFGLERKEGGGSVQYSVITFNRGADLAPTDAAAAKRYGRQVKALVTQDKLALATTQDSDVVVGSASEVATSAAVSTVAPVEDAGVAAVAAAFDAQPVAAGGLDIDGVDF